MGPSDFIGVVCHWRMNCVVSSLQWLEIALAYTMWLCEEKSKGIKNYRTYVLSRCGEWLRLFFRSRCTKSYMFWHFSSNRVGGIRKYWLASKASNSRCKNKSHAPLILSLTGTIASICSVSTYLSYLELNESRSFPSLPPALAESHILAAACRLRSSLPKENWLACHCSLYPPTGLLFMGHFQPLLCGILKVLRNVRPWY